MQGFPHVTNLSGQAVDQLAYSLSTIPDKLFVYVLVSDFISYIEIWRYQGVSTCSIRGYV